MKRTLALLVALEVGDGLATCWALSQGLAGEANPFVAPLAGSWNFLLLKVIGAAASALALWFLYHRFPRAATFCANSVVLLYMLVLGWNLVTVLPI